MARNYQPFVLRIDEPNEDGFSVRADFRGSTWTATIPRELPLLKTQEIEQAKLWLERGFIDREYAKDFGRRLFQTLFQDAIREGFRAAYERVTKNDDALRIVLTLPPSLAGLPWELMYDEEGEHGFLARSATAPLVRHYDMRTLPHQLPARGPLRILLVTASPAGYPAISSDEEVEKITRSLSKRIGFLSAIRLLWQHLRHTFSLSAFLGRLRQRNYFEIDVLSHATTESFQRKMAEAQVKGLGYHVVHFIGHGLVDENGSYLVFESEDTKAALVDSEAFAEILGEPTVNLAVLNACQTASGTDLFRGVAQATLQKGVPAVIGMQVPILDRTAIDFAEEFYGAWAAGQPIESALSYARRLIQKETSGAAADWGSPILFMRPTEGLQLDLTTPTLYVPPAIRFLKWTITAFLSLLGTIGLLLTIPNVNQQLRTEAPIIRCLFPYSMGDGFNVVINRFMVVDENGSVISSKDGEEVAVYLYQQLTHNIDELDLDEPYEVRPPGHTCRIEGNTREEREANAAKLAGLINAHVIVYGVITDTPGRDSFAPEFFVDYKGFEEGEEVTGQYELGDALRVILPFDSSKIIPTDNPALSARTKALSLLTTGLSYYSVDNFEEASNYFLQSMNTKGWSDVAGKEVIYLLLGNASNRRASLEKNPIYLQDSLIYYGEALRINDTYARAMVGNAGALYSLALGNFTDNDLTIIDLPMLEEAIKLYNAALQIEDSPATANIETKVHFGLGKIYLAQALHALTTGGDSIPLQARAESEFQEVVNEFNNGNDRIENFAGHSYARLGLLARLEKRTADAVDLYTHAIELVTPYYEAYYYTRLGEVHVDSCKLDLASQAYEEAIQTAEFFGFEEEVATYTERQNEIKNMQCSPTSG